MKYWLTTHWPHRIDVLNPGPPSGVWLQHDKLHAAKGMGAGDQVLIYESGSGDAILEKYPDGTTKTIRRRKGRQGVVALADILDQPTQPDNNKPEEYVDGSQRWWKWCAPTQSLNSAGFIPRRELAKALGYKPDNPFRGYGTDHSGLAEIKPALFAQLKQRFLQSVDDQDATTKRAIAKGKWGGSGGEGPVHRALKQAIAADPSGELGEEGLTHWATEHKLPTGDTVDVVLKDRYGRLVAVEIEVDCDENERIGPLQCMKYRAMLGYLYKRPMEEVRAKLIAHSIHKDVVGLCSDYHIECSTRPRKAL